MASSLDKANFLRYNRCHSGIENVTVDLWDVDDGVPENYAELTLYPTYEVTFGKNLRECDIKTIGYTRWPDDPTYPRWKLVDGFFKVFVIGRPDDLKFTITAATEYLKHQLELAIKNEVLFYGRSQTSN